MTSDYELIYEWIQPNSILSGLYFHDIREKNLGFLYNVTKYSARVVGGSSSRAHRLRYLPGCVIVCRLTHSLYFSTLSFSRFFLHFISYNVYITLHYLQIAYLNWQQLDCESKRERKRFEACLQSARLLQDCFHLQPTRPDSPLPGLSD